MYKDLEKYYWENVSATINEINGKNTSFYEATIVTDNLICN